MPRAIILLTAFVCLVAPAAHAVPMTDGFDYPWRSHNGSDWAITGYSFSSSGHCGEDWNWGSGRSDYGLPLYSVSNGQVVWARYSSSGWGKIVLIQHNTPDGVRTSLYAHLKDVSVVEGQSVTRGQEIGTCGDAEGEYSPHLHFELRLSASTTVGDAWGCEEGQTNPSGFIDGHRPPWNVATKTWDGAVVAPADDTETDGWDVVVRGAVRHPGCQPTISRVLIFIQGEYVGDATYGIFYPITGENIGFSYTWNARRWANHTVTVQALAIDSLGGRSDGVATLTKHGIHPPKTTILPPTSLQVSPTDPTSGDDLVATASGGSDIDGEAIVGYQYEWSSDGGATWPYGGATLPKSLTLSGHKWLVRALTIGNHVEEYQRSSGWVVSGPVTIRDWEGLLEQPASDTETKGWDIPITGWLKYRGPQPPTQEVRIFIQGVEQKGVVSLSDSGGKVSFSYQWDAREWAGHTVTVQALGVDNGGGRSDGVESLTSHEVHVPSFPVPTVTAWTPTGTGVPAELPTLTASFSAPMDKPTAEAAFSVSPAKASGVAHGWPGTFSWVGNKLQYKLSTSLKPSTTYTVKITTAAKSAAGVAMGADKTWTFKTNNLPAVVSYAPTGTAVPLSTTGNAIRIAFNQTMNKAAVQGALWMYPATSTPQSPTRPAGTFSWVGNEMRYVLSSKLTPRTSYTVKLGTGAKSSAGVARATDFVWTFKTKDEPIVTLHAPTGTAVALSTSGKVVRIGFNRAMNKAAVQGALWIYKTASTPTCPTRPAGAFSWVGNEMRYTFTSKLAPLTDYTARLGTTALSSTGVRLGEPFEWTFKTGGANTAPGGVTVASAPTATGAQITLNLTSAADVTVSVRNLAGREIALLTPGKLEAGVHSVLWDGKSRTGTRVPAGTYLLQVSANAAEGTRAQALTALPLR